MPSQAPGNISPAMVPEEGEELASRHKLHGEVYRSLVLEGAAQPHEEGVLQLQQQLALVQRVFHL